MSKAIQINPQLAEAYGIRGVALAFLGSFQAAIEDMTKASELFKKQGNQEQYQRILKALEVIKKKV